MVQFKRYPVSTVRRRPSSFATGRTPGRPRHTGHTLVFGGAPNSLAQPHHIFDLVLSWTCVSSPMTASYSIKHCRGKSLAGRRFAAIKLRRAQISCLVRQRVLSSARMVNSEPLAGKSNRTERAGEGVAGNRPARALQTCFCVLVILLAVFQFSENTADVDLWGHVVFGQEMLKTHSIPKTDTYSWTAAGRPWINHECLAEIALGGGHLL